MAHVKFAVVALSGALMMVGCTSQPLPANASSYDLDVVGTWHASEASDSRSFDDYVFQKDGSLVTLRSVMDGVTVTPMAGVGIIRNVAQASVACVFGSTWRSEDEQTITVDGTCTDGAAREIELGFDAQSTTTVQVAVRAVENEKSWMEPTAWVFEKCEPGCN